MAVRDSLRNIMGSLASVDEEKWGEGGAVLLPDVPSVVVHVRDANSEGVELEEAAVVPLAPALLAKLMEAKDEPAALGVPHMLRERRVLWLALLAREAESSPGSDADGRSDAVAIMLPLFRLLLVAAAVAASEALVRVLPVGRVEGRALAVPPRGGGKEPVLLPPGKEAVNAVEALPHALALAQLLTAGDAELLGLAILVAVAAPLGLTVALACVAVPAVLPVGAAALALSLDVLSALSL